MIVVPCKLLGGNIMMLSITYNAGGNPLLLFAAAAMIAHVFDCHAQCKAWQSVDHELCRRPGCHASVVKP